MKTILCYGDSNTYGLRPDSNQRYPREIRWTGLLQKSLGEDYYVIEEGLSGRTTLWDDPIEESVFREAVRQTFRNATFQCITDSALCWKTLFLRNNAVKIYKKKSRLLLADGFSLTF